MTKTLPYACPTFSLIHILGKRWSVPIIESFDSARNEVQFNAIRKSIGDITPKNLSRSLKELCDAEVLERSQMEKDGMRHTTYNLTKKGAVIQKFIVDTKRLGVCIYGIDASCVYKKCSQCPLMKTRAGA